MAKNELFVNVFMKRTTSVVNIDNTPILCYYPAMTSTLMLNERHILADQAFVEMVVWLLDHPLSPSGHNYKYRLAFVVNGKCVVRYDNEAGKGDHKHIGDTEIPYPFFSPQTLLDDFWADVNQWRI